MIIPTQQPFALSTGEVYYCENGAWHDYPCSEHCWNKHPEHKEGEDFRVDQVDRVNEIMEEAALKVAMEAGFTKKQAKYLIGGRQNVPWGLKSS